MEGKMNDAEFNQWLEIAVRRPLTADEETRLRALLAEQPPASGRWEEETVLTRLLHRLPDAPLSSNFTAQVLLAVEREEQGRAGAPKVVRWLDWRRPAVRFAATSLFLALAVVGFHQYQTFMRAKMAVSLANVTNGVDTAARAAQLQAVELWQDFEPIYRLGHSQAQADVELLAALK
jgi:anti-sigma factor RsiW